MTLIDGKAISEQIKQEIATEVAEIVARGGKRPHLAAILVGHDGGSETYVAAKVKACEACGFKSSLIRYETDVTEEELLAKVRELNEDADVDGFIVQLPLPKHISEQKVIETIDYRKDVDGFHPINVGRMSIGLPCYVSATPNGILELLKRYKIETSGKKCVVLGRGVTLIMQARVFDTFFKETGTDTTVLAQVFTSGHFYITIVCVLAVLVLAFFLIRNVTVFAKVKGILHNVWVGVLSLRHVKRMPLFILYTVGIWTCYFLQFYVSFFCFDFSDNLGVMAGLVMFAVGSIAVVVPTPNGAGPWHFAVITMMMLYGVGKEDAGIFALLVHGIQTFLLILLGIYGLAALPFTNKTKKL